MNRQIIGVPQGKTADMTGSTGGRMVVLLNGGQYATTLNGKPSNQLLKVNTIGLVRHLPARASACWTPTPPMRTAGSSSCRPTSRPPGRSGARARHPRRLGGLDDVRLVLPRLRRRA